MDEESAVGGRLGKGNKSSRNVPTLGSGGGRAGEMDRQHEQREVPGNGCLVLENGRVFEGRLFGSQRALPQGGLIGEVVFTTGMTGYLETLSDPSCHGQIVVQTFPLIGNYGAIREDFESPCLQPLAYVVAEWCEHPSNFRSQGNLDGLMAGGGLIGLSGVDTRALTRVIREAGVMNGAIVRDPGGVDLESLASHALTGAVAAVSTRKVMKHEPDVPCNRCVVLWDFGAKENIVRSLCARGAEVLRVPHGTSARDIMALEPDGVMLSNGPGDPVENTAIISEIGELLKRVQDAVPSNRRAEASKVSMNRSDGAGRKVPVFGICLGHQLLALATGARTQKLKYGHRGANQPVRDVRSGHVSITTQNHGYAVRLESVDTALAEIRYVNANDGTCEGLDYRGIEAFGVQFHPEAAAGPQDTAFLFDRFFAMMDTGGEQRCR